MLSVLVIGAGAIGGYAGAMLARAGHDVTLLARGGHARALAAKGVVIEWPTETATISARVVERMEEVPAGSADVVLVAVKAKDLGDVASKIARVLSPRGLAVPLLNGLDSETILASVLGAERVMGAIVQLAARIVAPGEIRVDGPARFVFAPLAKEGFAAAEALAKSLSCPGLACDARPDLQRLLWGKLLWNAPFNGVCALTRRTAGEVLAVPELEALVRGAMQEVIDVARAEGVTFGADAIDANLDATRKKYADSVPSMLEDVRQSRETEARALQGAVAERGRRHGIATPIHDSLLALLLGLHPRSGAGTTS